MTSRTVAIIGARWPDLSVEREVLRPLGVEVRDDPGTDPRGLQKVISGADVVILGPAPSLDMAALVAFGGSGIVRYGVGVDNVDLKAARRLGMWVVIVPDYGTEAVAIHAVALILACVRKLTLADGVVRAGRWTTESLRPLHLPESLTAGIIGYGRIGRRVTELLAALGFGQILVTTSQQLTADDCAERTSLRHLLRSSNVVSLHVPASPDGSALLDRENLSLMREGSVLVNTARGSLVDTDALADGLAIGRPAFAGLDVVEPYPPDLDRFADVDDRVLFSPHAAWYTEESEHLLRTSAAEEAYRLLVGEEPLNPVVRPP